MLVAIETPARGDRFFDNIRYEHGLEVVEVYTHCEDAAHNNACENDTRLSNVETIQRAVDQGKDFEE